MTYDNPRGGRKSPLTGHIVYVIIEYDSHTFIRAQGSEHYSGSFIKEE